MSYTRDVRNAIMEAMGVRDSALRADGGAAVVFDPPVGRIRSMVFLDPVGRDLLTLRLVTSNNEESPSAWVGPDDGRVLRDIGTARLRALAALGVAG